MIWISHCFNLIGIDWLLLLSIWWFRCGIFRIRWIRRYATAHLFVLPQQYRAKLLRYHICITKYFLSTKFDAYFRFTKCVSIFLFFHQIWGDDVNDSKDTIQLLTWVVSTPINSTIFFRTGQSRFEIIVSECIRPIIKYNYKRLLHSCARRIKHEQWVCMAFQSIWIDYLHHAVHCRETHSSTFIVT